MFAPCAAVFVADTDAMIMSGKPNNSGAASPLCADVRQLQTVSAANTIVAATELLSLFTRVMDRFLLRWALLVFYFGRESKKTI
jgi:hypothetical protein